MNEPDSESNGPPASRVPKRDTAAARKKSRDTGGGNVKKKEGEPKAMHFKDLHKLRFSASVRSVIEEGRKTAVNERFRGFFGTGLLLLSLETVGRNATRAEGHYAPRYFAEQIDRMAGARFTAARKKFYDANRLPADARPEEPEWFSLNLKGVFEEANRLPRHDGIIAARHVIVALLSFQPKGAGKTTNAWEILRDAGLDRRKLLADFLGSLANDGPIAEQADWKRIAELHPRPSARKPEVASSPPPPVRGPWIAGFDADRPTGRAADDCLNLDATINAMANLIASPQLDGTMSLGVFGNWGSGKSFFLARLREAIDEITARAAARTASDVKPEYWSNVAQVEFNAWHYVDANLWASLMSHLLDVLRRWAPAGRTVPVRNSLARAIEQLEITSTTRNEAVQRQRVAEEAEAKAKSKLENARRELASAADRLRAAVTRSLWTFVEGKLGAEKDRAVQSLRKLGLLGTEANQSLESVFAQIRNVTSTGGRIDAVLHQLLCSKDGQRTLQRWGLVACGAVIVLVIASFWAEWLRNAGAVFATALAGAVAVATKAVAWVREHVAGVLDELAPLMTIRANIEIELAAAETQKSTLVSGIEQEVAACQANLAAATMEVATREKEVREAVQAVADAVSGRAVRQFIEQRLAAGDYQKHLGLIATIRRDFEQLSDLIRAHNATRLSLSAEAKKIESALRRARPDIGAAELAEIFTNIGINRIVLYIDDLDRCPSNRVVEVLQAIHLLLSFPIFVVVVGVDSRWMSHSLAREYPSLLTRAVNGETAAKGWSREARLSVVTPADYLEKIFQIPFWVPPLKTASAQTLIGKLTKPVGVAESSPPAMKTKPGDEEQPASPVNPTPQSNDPAKPQVRTTSGESPSGAPGGTTKSGDDSTMTETNAVILPPAILVVDDDERAAMQSLATIIGRSPRATKRFINSYRLLKAAVADAERLALSGEDAPLGGMAAPMFLLAIVTGIPTLTAEFVGMLPANPRAQALDQLFALAKWAAADAVHADAAKRIHEFQRSADQTRWQHLSGAQLKPWVTRVAQFSFEDLVPSDERGGPPAAVVRSGRRGSKS